MFKSRRIKEEEPRRDEPETEERSAAKKVGGSSSNVYFVSPKWNKIGKFSCLKIFKNLAKEFSLEI
jgi:hypothetical protein